MKILFVSQWYFPEPDGRVSALAEGLVERGHEVVVITGFPNYPQGKIYSGYRLKWRQWEEIKGVRVLRLPLYADHSHSKFKRALNYLSFSLSLFILAPWFIKKPDVIWSYTPFVALPTIWFHKLFRIPYVMEIADIWPDTITATGMMKEGLILKLMANLAKFAYRNATAITVQNMGFKPCLAERGADAEKIIVIENWADENLFYPIDYDKSFAKKNGMDGKFNIIFAGNMGLAQGLNNIILAAKICRDNDNIQFVFVGDGACLNEIKDMVEKEGLSNVLFISRKPISEMARFYSIADVLLVNLRDDPLFEITLPGKTQSYLACGRPIIIAKRGVDAESLSEYGCAIKCEPDNPQALAEAVIKIFNMTADERERMGEYSLELYKKKYRKEELLRKMEVVLENSA